MGAADTAAGDRTNNDDIATKGRMETSQGMAKMRGAGAGANAGYSTGGTGSYNTTTPATGGQYDDTGVTGGGYSANQGVGAGLGQTEHHQGGFRDQPSTGHGQQQSAMGTDYQQGVPGEGLTQNDPTYQRGGGQGYAPDNSAGLQSNNRGFDSHQQGGY